VSNAHEACTELAKRITTWSQEIEDPTMRFYVCSGGGAGIMEAANKGAELAGGKSIGFNITLPLEQFLNPHITPELRFNFHYFFIRKFWFLYYAKALIGFPGGFGTMDEVFELLTLLQAIRQDVLERSHQLRSSAGIWRHQAGPLETVQDHRRRR